MMKFIFCIINIEVFYKLILSFWLCVTRHAESNKNKFAYLCNISIKVWGMKLIFCLQIEIKVFCKITVSFWVCVTRNAQSTQNNRFTLSLQYVNVKENVKDEADFLLIDKRCRFLQSDTVILCVWQASHITQNNKFAITLQQLKKEVSDFLHADKHESFIQVDIMILMEMVQYS